MATVELNAENFEKTVTDNGIVVIDFWASWCGPCKTFAPTFEAASEAHGDVVFGKVNTEKEQGLAQHFQVRSIPMLLVFKEQVPVFMQPGALPAEALESLLTQVKGLDMDEVRQKMAEHEHSHDHDDPDHTHDHE